MEERREKEEIKKKLEDLQAQASVVEAMFKQGKEEADELKEKIKSVENLDSLVRLREAQIEEARRNLERAEAGLIKERRKSRGEAEATRRLKQELSKSKGRSKRLLTSFKRELEVRESKERVLKEFNDFLSRSLFSETEKSRGLEAKLSHYQSFEICEFARKRIINMISFSPLKEKLIKRSNRQSAIYRTPSEAILNDNEINAILG